MHWKTDETTARAATNYPLPINRSLPIAPFRGRAFNTSSWNPRVVQPATWSSVLRSDPEQIIQQFRNERYTQGLAMVGSWGTMWRQPQAIWGGHKVETIETVLRNCAKSIKEAESIAGAWQMLRDELSWSSVAISKTLHFVCQSLGFDHDPPVPIDGAVIRGRVWPAFKALIPISERPESWDGHTFEAYTRYMTAICTWAGQRNWSTAEVERTLSLQFQPDWNDFCR